MSQAYPSGREGVIDTTITLTGTIKAALLRGYTFNAAHKFLADVTGSGATVVARTAALTGKTYTAGTFLVSNSDFGSVATGAACANWVVYQDNGSDATNRLIVFEDDSSGLPATPNGTVIPLVVNPSGLIIWGP